MRISENLSDDEKIQFSEEFLNLFLALGFGSMPKREIEILIFHLLYHKTKIFVNQSNYDIANELKISESKIKSFKAEASLKYQQMEHQEALQEIAKLFFEFNNTKTAFDGDIIQFALEDPVLKREFEHAVKELGYFVDYSFNREIVKVKARIFLEIFIQNFGQAETKYQEILKAYYRDEREYQKLITKAQTVDKQLEQFLGEHKNIAEVVVSIISMVTPIL